MGPTPPPYIGVSHIPGPKHQSESEWEEIQELTDDCKKNTTNLEKSLKLTAKAPKNGGISNRKRSSPGPIHFQGLC